MCSMGGNITNRTTETFSVFEGETKLENDKFIETLSDLEEVSNLETGLTINWRALCLMVVICVALCVLIDWLGSRDENLFIQGTTLFEDGRYEEGVEYFRKSMKWGGEEAIYALGRCYLDGIGVQRDTIEGLRLVVEAVEEAYSDAQYFWGQCHYYGQYAPLDKALAVKYLTYAARQDHPEAQCALGICYLNGEGVRQDIKAARKWFTKAKKNGSVQAEKCLKILDMN